MSIRDLLSADGALALSPSSVSPAPETGRMRAGAQVLLSTLLGLRSRIRPATEPRVKVRISVYAPSGRPAIHIRLGRTG